MASEPTTEQPSPKPVEDRYILGMKVRIEYPAGSVRTGKDESGQPWETTMANDYGYIDNTTGRDRKSLDVILSGKPSDAQRDIYVIDQVHPETGDFDEHKIVLGAADEGEAMDDYHANYPDDWDRLGGIRAMPLKDFKRWAFGQGRRVKPAVALKRGGRVEMASGGLVQKAKDLSLSQLSPFGGDTLGTLAGVAGGLLDASNSRSASGVTNTTGQNFTNETIGQDVIDHFKANPNIGVDNNYFTGADGYTYLAQNNSGGIGNEGGSMPVQNIRQFANKVGPDDWKTWNAAGYDKVFNTDGTFNDVYGNTAPEKNSGWKDFGSFALAAAALMSGNPALAFAKSMGSRIATGALSSMLAPDGRKPHQFGGVDKSVAPIDPNRPVDYSAGGYAHGGRVGALSLVRKPA